MIPHLAGRSAARIPLAGLKRRVNPDLSRNWKLKIEGLWSVKADRAVLLKNLKLYFLLKIETRPASALFETSSRGEQPFFPTMYIVAAKRSIMINTFGQAFSSH